MSGPLLSFDEEGGGLHRPVAEINVTPFVDVMLVLLIVFMVTAPMLAAGVKVDLPKAQGLPPVEQRQEPLIVSIRQDGSLYLGKDVVTPEALTAAIKARLATNPDVTAHIRADATVEYRHVLETMATLSQAGATRIAFIGQPGSAGTPAAGTAAGAAAVPAATPTP